MKPYTHPAALPDDELLAQCDLTRGRTSGPGGQHRNKVQTLVELRHTPTGVEAHAGERRSALENRRVALRRLRLALAVEHRAPVPAGEVGSDLWRARRKGGRIVVNPEHEDYPALLAEAVDVLAAANWDARRAALRLDVTASQLLKLVKDHPPAMVMWNENRRKRKMRALK